MRRYLFVRLNRVLTSIEGPNDGAKRGELGKKVDYQF